MRERVIADLVAGLMHLAGNAGQALHVHPALEEGRPDSEGVQNFEDIESRLAEGVENAVVLLREIRAEGYTGGYSILTDYLRPRRQRQPARTSFSKMAGRPSSMR